MDEQLTPHAQHIAWCKERALHYVDVGDLGQAVASMISDLGAEEGADSGFVSMMGQTGLMDAMRGDTAAVRRWIEGFR